MRSCVQGESKSQSTQNQRGEEGGRAGRCRCQRVASGWVGGQRAWKAMVVVQVVEERERVWYRSIQDVTTKGVELGLLWCWVIGKACKGLFVNWVGVGACAVSRGF